MAIPMLIPPQQESGSHVFSVRPAPTGITSGQSPNAAASSSRQPQVVAIDPSLLYNNHSSDDFSDSPTKAAELSYSPAAKATGSRRAGKQPVAASQSRKRAAPVDDEDLGEPPAKCGRPKGAGNYSTEDLKELLDATKSGVDTVSLVKLTPVDVIEVK